MTRHILSATTLAIFASQAFAHFPFLVPDGDAKGKAVFSDSIKPDDKGVQVDRIANTKLVVLTDGKAADVTWTLDKTGNFYAFEVPGSGPRLVVGTTDYGVLQRGESKPFLLRYHAKAVFGSLPPPDKCTAGDRVPLALIPIAADGKLRFRAISSGKPVAKTDVTVLVPGDEKGKVVQTDDNGLTPVFDKAGQYGAQVRMTDNKSGEQDGKKYDEIRHYATLVVRFGG